MSFHRDQAGLDLHAPSNQTAENVTGTDIARLSIVKYTGFGVDFPQISVINSTLDFASGIVDESGGIADGGTGRVVQIGFVSDMNTSSFSVGAIFADASGQITQSVTALEIGIVLVVDAIQGIIFFNVRGLRGAQGPSDPRVVGGIQSVSANATKVASWGQQSAVAEIAMDRAGVLNAITISLDTPRTAGICQLQLLINGIAQTGAGQTVDIDAANPQTATLVLAIALPFLAGDTIGLQTVTVAFTPNGADATVSARYSE